MGNSILQKVEISGERERSSFLPGLSSQQVFEKELAYELPIFVQIQETALEMMHQELKGKHPRFLNRNSKPTRMNENIRGLLFDRFPEHMKENKAKRFYFEKKDKYTILFKKLDNNFRPMHIPTKSAKNILAQLSMDLPRAPIVFVGYTPSRSWDELERICAVYISNNNVIWVSDLRKLNESVVTMELFSQEQDEDSPILVHPKKPIENQDNR